MNLEGIATELNQLRYFCSVAQTEHMTRSARGLRIAQPALTRSIHRLEDELGVKLFEPVGRNIRLTSEGHRFHELVAPALSRLDEAVDEVGRFAEAQARTVRVSVLSASNVVVDAVAAFAAEHPEATFELTQNASDERCDIRVSTVLPTPRPTEVALSTADQSLFCEPIGIAVPLESPHIGKIPLASLASERFICLAGSYQFRELCDALCTERGFTPQVGFDSDSPAMVKKMVALGLGVGFWPESSWGSLDGSGARWLPLAESGFERMLSIALATRAQEKPLAKMFYRSLVDTFEKGSYGTREI